MMVDCESIRIHWVLIYYGGRVGITPRAPPARLRWAPPALREQHSASADVAFGGGRCSRPSRSISPSAAAPTGCALATVAQRPQAVVASIAASIPPSVRHAGEDSAVERRVGGAGRAAAVLVPPLALIAHTRKDGTPARRGALRGCTRPPPPAEASGHAVAAALEPPYAPPGAAALSPPHRRGADSLANAEANSAAASAASFAWKCRMELKTTTSDGSNAERSARATARASSS